MFKMIAMASEKGKRLERGLEWRQADKIMR